MLLILLGNFRGIGIVLQNLLIGTTCKEDVLSVIRWMEFNTERSLAIGEALNHFASLCIPQLYDFVKTCTQESSAIITEANISNSFTMSHVSSHASSMSKYIPYFHCSIMTG
jgi:hypothetical protein